ncbi:MAG TPA: CBS domain-containing protein [Nitrolancea sp.]|nr:CBS domain-containing protein [Nitrolancea sp.]
MSPRAAARLESLGFSAVYDYVDGKADWYARGLPMSGKAATEPRSGQMACLDVPTARLDESIGAVRRRTEATRWDMAVVVNEERVVLGLLRPSALDQDPATLVETVMEAGPSTFRPNAALDDPQKYMERHRVGGVPITTLDGRLVGVLRREDLDQANHEEA